MDLKRFNLLINEENMSGVRAKGINKQIKDKMNDVYRIDGYSKMSDGILLDEFMKKFSYVIKEKNLNKENIREIAADCLKKLREKE